MTIQTLGNTNILCRAVNYMNVVKRLLSDYLLLNNTCEKAIHWVMNNLLQADPMLDHHFTARHLNMCIYNSYRFI